MVVDYQPEVEMLSHGHGPAEPGIAVRAILLLRPGAL